jgi:hypothetical protein
MTTPSPGPGWWLAADGNWYPQRWETTFVYYTNESLQAVIDEASRQSKAYGERDGTSSGPRCNGFRVAHRFSDYDKVGDHYHEWSIVCTLKRPLLPG